MRAIVAAISFAMLAVTNAAEADPAQDARFLPLTKSAIVALVAESLQSKALKAEPMTLPPAQRSGLAPDDSVWRIVASPIPVAIFIAGKDENVYALHVYFPVVRANPEDGKRIGAMLSALFKAIYPNWPDAEKWPQASLATTWNASPLMHKPIPADPNDLIDKKTIDGITSATVGVPPDLVVYSVTTRAQCIPDIRRGNPFQRVVC